MKRSLLNILMLAMCALTYGRSGEWKIYRNVSTYDQVEAFASRLFVRSGSTLMSTDYDNNEYTTLDKYDGLNGIEVAMIACTPSRDRLVIAYSDGLIDIMDTTLQVNSIFDLQNKSMNFSKAPNSLRFSGNKMYYAADFGFIVVDLEQLIIPITHYTASPCRLAFDYMGYYYCATDEQGLIQCPLGVNEAMNSNWVTIEDQTVTDALCFDTADGKRHCWYIDAKRRIHVMNEKGNTERTSLRACYKSLKQLGDYIFMCGDGFTVANANDYNITVKQSGTFSRSHDFTLLPDTTYVNINATEGLTRYYIDSFKSWGVMQCSFLYENRDVNLLTGESCLQMRVTDQGLRAIASKRMINNGWNGMVTTNGDISTLYDDETWQTLSYRDVLSQPAAQGCSLFRGVTDMAIHPDDPDDYYVSTLESGLFHFLGDSLCQWIPNAIAKSDPEARDTRLTAMAYDADGYLWVASSFSTHPLYSLSPDGQWQDYDCKSLRNASNISHILVSAHDEHHYKWLLSDYPYMKSSVCIYDDNGTPADPADDHWSHFSTLIDQDANEYNLEWIYDLVEDHSGRVWILTSKGPFVVESQAQCFQQPGRVRRIKIPRNDGTNLADYLFENTSCTCMAIDNFDRKWIGTSDAGLYLLSSDCITELQHFTSENSPLISNSILSLAYDAEHNYLYASSLGGIMRYETDDVPGESDFGQLSCYPNPVRPTYSGVLHIEGLMAGSTVSITDTYGNIIMRTQSIGSNLIYNLRNAQGQRLSPGIYYIHAVSNDADQGDVCKFLVL